jgi:hypothetical protein
MPRFTLRDVFWLTAIVAVWAAWVGLVVSGYYAPAVTARSAAGPFAVAGFAPIVGALIGAFFRRAMLGATLATGLAIGWYSLWFGILSSI